MLSNILSGATRSFLAKHGPKLALLAGTIGFVTTNVLVAKATIKAERAVQARKEELEVKELSKKEELKIRAKEYVIPVATGLVATGMIFLGNKKYASMQAGLASAYALADKNYNKYKDKIDTFINSKLGNDENEKVMSLDKITVYNEFEDEFFDTTWIELVDAEYQYNREFARKGWASVNEFRQLLGLPYTTIGEEWGHGMEHVYDITGGCWIDFTHDLSVVNGRECYILRYEVIPETGYQNN